MLAQPQSANNLQAAQDVPGKADGKIGTRTFKADVCKWRVNGNNVDVFLIDKDNEVPHEELLIQVSQNTKFNEEYSLDLFSTSTAWVTFNATTPPGVVQCTDAKLIIKTLSLSPFEVKGSLRGKTDDPGKHVDVTFHLQQPN